MKFTMTLRIYASILVGSKVSLFWEILIQMAPEVNKNSFYPQKVFNVMMLMNPDIKLNQVALLFLISVQIKTGII